MDLRKRKLMFFNIAGNSVTIFSTIPTEYCYHDAYSSVRDLAIFRKVEMLTPECYEQTREIFQSCFLFMGSNWRTS